MENSDLEKLQERLDKQLSWRKQELFSMYTQIMNSSGNDLNVFLRAGVTLLYAHWEGYIKMASREYLKFLNEREIKVNDLKDNFILLHLKKSFKNLDGSNKLSTFSSLLYKFKNLHNENFKVKYTDEDIINTHSNLSYSVLSEIIFNIGVNMDGYDLKQHYIDKKLVETRNRICHGEYTDFNKNGEYEAKQDFDDLYHTIIKWIDSFKDQIVNSGLEKQYLSV